MWLWNACYDINGRCIRGGRVCQMVVVEPQGGPQFGDKPTLLKCLWARNWIPSNRLPWPLTSVINTPLFTCELFSVKPFLFVRQWFDLCTWTKILKCCSRRRKTKESTWCVWNRYKTMYKTMTCSTATTREHFLITGSHNVTGSTGLSLIP